MPKFKKSERLTKPSEFKIVKGSRYRVTCGRFILAWCPKEERRLGLIVGKTVAKKAHNRNRIKRIVREFFRLNKDRFPLGDCVVIAKNGAASLENEEIRGYLKSLVEKVAYKTL